MHCIGCDGSADGFAVIPGIGEAGEIRFYCDTCARRNRVKMRYWDGRDLDVGGWRESPDLGPSFASLILAFDDFARMRHEDIAAALAWVDDRDLLAALTGAPAKLLSRVLGVLRPDRARRIREAIASGELPKTPTPVEAQAKIVDLVRRL
jgi:hypothetical protein